MSKLRAAVAAAVAVLLFCAGAASAQTEPPVLVRAEDCLRAHVDRVVADDSDLQSAATFLVTYACATEVSKAQTYESNLLIASQLNAMVKSMTFSTQQAGAPSGAGPAPPPPPPDFTATVDPETGDLVISPAPPGTLMALMPLAMRQAASQMTGGAAPVSLRELAGELVVDAYERRHAAAPGAERH